MGWSKYYDHAARRESDENERQLWSKRKGSTTREGYGHEHC